MILLRNSYVIDESSVLGYSLITYEIVPECIVVAGMMLVLQRVLLHRMLHIWKIKVSRSASKPKIKNDLRMFFICFKSSPNTRSKEEQLGNEN